VQCRSLRFGLYVASDASGGAGLCRSSLHLTELKIVERQCSVWRRLFFVIHGHNWQLVPAITREDCPSHHILPSCGGHGVKTMGVLVSVQVTRGLEV
jgi:hypothetical protein